MGIESRALVLEKATFRFVGAALRSREVGFLFPESVFAAENVALSIESDALAIVGATLGSSKAPARLRSVPFERAERVPETKSRNRNPRSEVSAPR